MKAEKEGGVIKRMVDPGKPRKQEVEDHNRTHIPYRNWCPVCVKARGKDTDHRAEVGKERDLSEYSFDYCFPGDEFGFKLTVLVGRERVSGALMATTIPTKGSCGRFTMWKVLDFVRECGDAKGKLVMRSDQEPIINF